jgi:hypothetical protein
MAQTQFNADGLLLKFGTDAPGPTNAGESKTYGPMREIVLTIPDMTQLTSSSVIQSDQLFFPINARVQEVVVISETACTSAGSPTLDIGIINTDRSTVPTNGGTAFVSALALTSINGAGKQVTLNVGSTSAGNFIGTTNATVGYLTARANTATYTAGKVVVKIRYYRP